MNDDLIDFQIRCPVKNCYGWVNYIDDFYGCGHCGNVWFNKEDLLNDILLIIRKYEHRKYSYDENNLLCHSKKEILNYEELVNTE